MEWLLAFLGCVAFAALVTVLWAVTRVQLGRLISRPRSGGAAGDGPDQRHHPGR